MAAGRRPRHLLAVALVCLVAFLTFHHRDSLSDLRSKYVPTAGAPTHSEKTGEPDPAAHKLPWADSFRATSAP
jgi:alpha 1,2-mannosyltransferase